MSKPETWFESFPLSLFPLSLSLFRFPLSLAWITATVMTPEVVKIQLNNTTEMCHKNAMVYLQCRPWEYGTINPPYVRSCSQNWVAWSEQKGNTLAQQWTFLGLLDLVTMLFIPQLFTDFLAWAKNCACRRHFQGIDSLCTFWIQHEGSCS